MKQKRKRITVGTEKESVGVMRNGITQTNIIKEKKKMMMTYSFAFSQLSPFKAARIYQDQSMQHN